MQVPSATYRIQFHSNFKFADAEGLIPYLHELGASHLYSSPYMKARRGSEHGYDVADPLHINAELGTEQEVNRLVERLRQHGMGLLLDIVPNHMAASPENPWWMHVLENGRESGGRNLKVRKHVLRRIGVQRVPGAVEAGADSQTKTIVKLRASRAGSPNEYRIVVGGF